MTTEEFRLVGHQVIDWVADYCARVAELPVMSTVEPGSVRTQLPERPPEQGEPFATILDGAPVSGACPSEMLPVQPLRGRAHMATGCKYPTMLKIHLRQGFGSSHARWISAHCVCPNSSTTVRGDAPREQRQGRHLTPSGEVASSPWATKGPVSPRRA